MSEWIDVRDELPDKNEAYLVAWTTKRLKINFVGICGYDAEDEQWDIRGMYQWDIYRDDMEITHWMPLPEAPKKEVQ